jgi:transcriptional regulator with XRE-family HTH domain
MAAPNEGPEEPAHTGELVRRLREAAGLSVEAVALRAAIAPQRLEALETGEGVSELGYAEVCALVRATQRPRPAWWSDDFEHDLTVTRLGPPATAEGRHYWSQVGEVREQLEDSGRSRPA